MIFSCPGSSIPALVVVDAWHFRIWTQRVTFETWDPSDIWSEWCLEKKTKGQKGKKTKSKKDKKTKGKKGKKTNRQKDKDQKGSFLLWRLSSFVLLLCLKNLQSFKLLKVLQRSWNDENPESKFWRNFCEKKVLRRMLRCSCQECITNYKCTICVKYSMASHYLCIFLLRLPNSESQTNPNNNLVMRRTCLRPDSGLLTPANLPRQSDDGSAIQLAGLFYWSNVTNDHATKL